MKTPRNASFSTHSEPSKEVDDLARKVIGAAIEVHRALGPGYLESVYEKALVYEINLNNIPYPPGTTIVLLEDDRLTIRAAHQFQCTVTKTRN